MPQLQLVPAGGKERKKFGGEKAAGNLLTLTGNFGSGLWLTLSYPHVMESTTKLVFTFLQHPSLDAGGGGSSLPVVLADGCLLAALQPQGN